MLRIYVAGAYSSDSVVNIFGNMRRGIHLACKVFKHGMAPFVPWFDYQFSLIEEFPVQQFYNYSMAWLEASDAVLVVPEGYEKSIGTQKELNRARELGIPIFFKMEDLIEWNKTKPHLS